MLRIGGKTAHHVHVAIQELKKQYGEQFVSIFKTITSDNGSEFSELTEAIQFDTPTPKGAVFCLFGYSVSRTSFRYGKLLGN